VTDHLINAKCNALAAAGGVLYGRGALRHSMAKTFIYNCNGFVLFVNGDLRESRLWNDAKPLEHVRNYIDERLECYETA